LALQSPRIAKEGTEVTLRDKVPSTNRLVLTLLQDTLCRVGVAFW
jgi:hypothetical protein